MSAEMKNTLVESKLLRDGYRCVKHASGLTVSTCIRKREMQHHVCRVSARATAPSTTVFQRSDEAAPAETAPAGIAHYLEHKLFESEDGDAFEPLCRDRRHRQRVYVPFETTLLPVLLHGQRSSEALGDPARLRAVPLLYRSRPLQKEHGIIGQEIKMYDDDPAVARDVQPCCKRHVPHATPSRTTSPARWRALRKSPRSCLYRCYNTFYNLNNMALCVCGNCTEEEVLALCDKMLKKSEPVEVERV